MAAHMTVDIDIVVHPLDTSQMVFAVVVGIPAHTVDRAAVAADKAAQVDRAGRVAGTSVAADSSCLPRRRCLYPATRP